MSGPFYLWDDGWEDAQKKNGNKFLSQEEIDALFDDKKNCSHSFVNYTGLQEVYKFCTKCDLKLK